MPEIKLQHIISVSSEDKVRCQLSSGTGDRTLLLTSTVLGSDRRSEFNRRQNW